MNTAARLATGNGPHAPHPGSARRARSQPDAPRRETRPLEPGEIFLCVHYPACQRGGARLIAGTSFCAEHARMEGV